MVRQHPVAPLSTLLPRPVRCRLLPRQHLSSDGVFANPPGFFAPVVDSVHAAGDSMSLTRCSLGFTRLGELWWGFQRHGVIPDVVTLGKPMGNGIPISAAVFRPEIAESFGRDVRYFNAFGW